MSSNRQYTDEFKSEAVRQVIERVFTVADVARGSRMRTARWCSRTCRPPDLVS